MAEGFRFAGSTFDSTPNEANELEDVQRTTFVAQPSNVAFTVTAPTGDEMLSRTQEEASRLAAVFNGAFATAGVEGLATSEQVTPAGAVQSVVYVTVSSTSGKSSTQVTVPQASLEDGALAPAVDAARAQLDALEAI